MTLHNRNREIEIKSELDNEKQQVRLTLLLYATTAVTYNTVGFCCVHYRVLRTTLTAVTNNTDSCCVQHRRLLRTTPTAVGCLQEVRDASESDPPNTRRRYPPADLHFQHYIAICYRKEQEKISALQHFHNFFLFTDKKENKYHLLTNDLSNYGSIFDFHNVTMQPTDLMYSESNFNIYKTFQFFNQI